VEIVSTSVEVYRKEPLNFGTIQPLEYRAASYTYRVVEGSVRQCLALRRLCH